MWMCINVFIDLQKCSSMVPLYVVAIASYHRGAHLMKPQFPVNLRTTLSQGCYVCNTLVTTLALLFKVVTRLLQPCEVVNRL